MSCLGRPSQPVNLPTDIMEQFNITLSNQLPTAPDRNLRIPLSPSSWK